MTRKLSQGFIHVYTGDGKGKTTAALGQAFRSIGHGFKVYMILFMKGNIEYGELETARKLKTWIEIEEMGRETFVSKGNPDPVDVLWAKKGLEKARQILTSGRYDLLVLDEINVAVDFGLLESREVLELMARKPPWMELLLTGRYAHPDIVKAADLVTEMNNIKHYYDQGVIARVGVER
jgi:cob(I)alamin adenosyltransferase